MKNFILTLCLFFISLTAFAMDYGIDRVMEASVRTQLAGKNLALLTHAAAKDKKGRHLIDLLFDAYAIKKIFAPEHGLRHLEDTWIADGVDEATGLPVISLYKQTTKAPDPKDLKDIDAIVIDLQDVGVRYYTYFSTIAEVMKVAARLNIEIILLDRPNLLGGKIMEGKVLDAEFIGRFTAYHTVPTRHGMTLGELALMVNDEQKINAKLTVVPVVGWQRERVLGQLDRPWLPPSPALINVAQVGLYAMWGTLESFNLAVGRGRTNELAFRVLGAPWITVAESKKLASALNQMGLKGLRFQPFSWQVTRSAYSGRVANGIKMDWNWIEVPTDEFTYKLSSLLIQMFPGRISNTLSPVSLGSRAMLNAIKAGVPWHQYSAIIRPELREFEQRRIPYLLY